eukprot:TRINITY_DN17412_c0_g1_i1.p1 TRINITY_DN17412_c0_g1~~TRINITY_DN17412_c0_g1_i1.p1  ORF type:complete len:223 (+),score=35.27 TRINITY_DN17412_c0_g1_i1:38-706(+)
MKQANTTTTLTLTTSNSNSNSTSTSPDTNVDPFGGSMYKCSLSSPIAKTTGIQKMALNFLCDGDDKGTDHGMVYEYVYGDPVAAKMATPIEFHLDGILHYNETSSAAYPNFEENKKRADSSDAPQTRKTPPSELSRSLSDLGPANKKPKHQDNTPKKSDKKTWTKMTPDLFLQISLWEEAQNGLIKQADIEKKWNVNRTTYYRWKQRKNITGAVWNKVKIKC